MSPPTSPSATILCVEDETSQLFLRKLLLESEGYTVITAESGQEALKLFKAHSVDLVILDYWMSGLNGVSVARGMKRLKFDIPIIIFSAYQSLPGEVIGVADAWLRKGETETADLLDEVATLLKRQRAKSASCE
ncbi:MAG: response regulator [Acidobacteria bacterium]|nr:MAG: response regulator [Acidobacteriota bacterium]